MKYVNIILLIILSWFLAHSEINKKEIEYFDDNVYSYSINDTITVTHTIQLTKELEWATRLIQSEAMNEPDSGKIAVVQTILNRVEYNTFRGRRTSFTYEIQRPGQVDGYKTKYWYYKLRKENIRLAYKALYGERVVPKSVYFWHNPISSTDKSHLRWAEGNNGEYIWKDIGNHRFCYAKTILINHPEYLDII
jgi:spore germination cell wall hydrolase CwlJ-like protein